MPPSKVVARSRTSWESGQRSGSRGWSAGISVALIGREMVSTDDSACGVLRRYFESRPCLQMVSRSKSQDQGVGDGNSSTLPDNCQHILDPRGIDEDLIGYIPLSSTLISSYPAANLKQPSFPLFNSQESITPLSPRRRVTR